MKRPLVNLLSLLLGDLGTRFIGFFLTVYLARVLEPTGFGIMNVGLAVLGYLQLAGSPGIQVLETRNTAAFFEVDRARVNAVLSLRILLAAILWILMAAVVFLCVKDTMTREVIMLFSLAVFPLAIMLDWFFQGKEAFIEVSLSRLIHYGVYGALVLLFVHTVNEVRGVAIAFGVGTLAAAAVLWSEFTRRWGSIKLQWTPGVWKEILTKGIPVGAAVFLTQSVTNLPPLVIGYFTSAGDIGLYSSAMKLVFLLLLVDRLLNALFLPVATRYFVQQRGELNRLVDVTLRVVSALIVPVAVLGVVLSKEVIMLLFGEGYQGASLVLRILMGYFALTVLNSVFVCVLIASGNEKGYTRMVVRGSGVLCVATVAGTALFGVLGAAYAVVIGELITVCLMMVEAGEVVRVSWIRILATPLIAGGFMAGTLMLLLEMNPAVLIAIALVVFAGIEFLLKGITEREIQFLRERFV